MYTDPLGHFRKSRLRIAVLMVNVMLSMLLTVPTEALTVLSAVNTVAAVVQLQTDGIKHTEHAQHQRGPKEHCRK